MTPEAATPDRPATPDWPARPLSRALGADATRPGRASGRGRVRDFGSAPGRRQSLPSTTDASFDVAACRRVDALLDLTVTRGLPGRGPGRTGSRGAGRPGEGQPKGSVSEWMPED